MATLTISDEVAALAKTRAAEHGYANVEEYVETVLRADAFDGPDGLRIGSDQELESLLLSRFDGPWVEMDDADLAQIRAKFQAHLDREAGKS